MEGFIQDVCTRGGRFGEHLRILPAAPPSALHWQGHGHWLLPDQAIQESKQGGSLNATYDLVSQVLYCNFSYILFFRSKSLRLSYSQGQKIRLLRGVYKKYMDIFKNHYRWHLKFFLALCLIISKMKCLNQLVGKILELYEYACSHICI